jgi:hypothetical protein
MVNWDNGQSLFQMSGAAFLDANNDVYVNGNTRYITITGNLTGATPVATITPASYVAGRQVLAESGGSWLAGNYGKFALSNGAWHIGSDGKLAQ